MKKSISILLILIPFVFTSCNSEKELSAVLKSKEGGWEVSLNDSGSIEQLNMLFNGELVQIPWRTDSLGGPSWEGVILSKANKNRLLFEGKNAEQIYSLEYLDMDGKFTIIASIQNESTEPFRANPATRLIVGIDNEMKDPSTYYGCFFPTLLRCEKNHFWGYFQNPNDQILTIASPDAIASRQINYSGMGHRIATSSLDMFHKLPLPDRHPQNLEELAPGEKRTWTIVFQPAGTLDEVLPIVASNCQAPALQLKQTTAAPYELIELTVFFDAIQQPDVMVTNPSGEQIKLPTPKVNENTLLYTISAPEEVGNYSIKAISNTKQSEAIFHVRKPWGWYLKQARDEALRMQIKPMMHREGWLSFFSAYWAQTFFPDSEKLAKTEEEFQKFYSLMVNPDTLDFYHDKPTWHSRPQNTSWMVGMMTARYAATKKIEDLEEAAKWGDLLITKFQLPNGAYEGYTALTLGAKFLRELAFYELPFAEKDSVWKMRYERHMLSVERASKNILEVKDLGDTEGESTFEDTQAGSAWSLLALHALNSRDKAMRQKFLDTSLEVQKRHECLTQAIIPDARMRNGTLRFWESQYDILTLPNMMNSPHGWTMRSQFGAFYLYLLTGEERFLNVMNNAMGACVQAIDEETGILRWAFVPDPYVEALEFVPDNENPGQGKRVPTIIGEQWMPMISDWWRVPEGEIGKLGWKRDGFHNVTQGWSCDNDVHEHFRVLAEEFIPNAFVLEREDGTLRTMNCSVEREGNTITIKPAEDVVLRVHLNLRKNYNIIIPFTTIKVEQKVEKGMHWVGPGGVPDLLR